jgi:hypothetical protein
MKRMTAKAAITKKMCFHFLNMGDLSKSVDGRRE